MYIYILAITLVSCIFLTYEEIVKHYSNETGIYIVLYFFKEFIYILSTAHCLYVNQGRLMGYKGFLCRLILITQHIQ